MAVRKEQSAAQEQERPVRKNGRRAPAGRPIRPDAVPERPPAPTGPAAEPTDEQIRARAYEIYLARGQTPGDPVDDWCRAERELRGQRSQSPLSPDF